jgi:hypothetical protein
MLLLASFGSYARKRYRFTGKERDEESGLCYVAYDQYRTHALHPESSPERCKLLDAHHRFWAADRVAAAHTGSPAGPRLPFYHLHCIRLLA